MWSATESSTIALLSTSLILYGPGDVNVISNASCRQTIIVAQTTMAPCKARTYLLQLLYK